MVELLIGAMVLPAETSQVFFILLERLRFSKPDCSTPTIVLQSCAIISCHGHGRCFSARYVGGFGSPNDTSRHLCQALATHNSLFVLSQMYASPSSIKMCYKAACKSDFAAVQFAVPGKDQGCRKRAWKHRFPFPLPQRCALQAYTPDDG